MIVINFYTYRRHVFPKASILYGRHSLYLFQNPFDGRSFIVIKECNLTLVMLLNPDIEIIVGIARFNLVNPVPFC